MNKSIVFLVWGLLLFSLFAYSALPPAFPSGPVDGNHFYTKGLVHEFNSFFEVWTPQNYFGDLNLLAFDDLNSSGSLFADGNGTFDGGYVCNATTCFLLSNLVDGNDLYVLLNPLAGQVISGTGDLNHLDGHTFLGHTFILGDSDDEVLVLREAAGATEHILSIEDINENHLFTILPSGEVDINHTGTENEQVALDIFVNAMGFADIVGLEIDYVTGEIGANQEEELIVLGIDDTLAKVGSEVVGILIAPTEGLSRIIGLEVGVLVNPIEQLSGVFENMTRVEVAGVDRLAEFISEGSNVEVFSNDDDNVLIGFTNKFEEIEWLLATVSSGPGISPAFEYSIVDDFNSFFPGDTTRGLRENGVMIWDDELIPAWSQASDGNFLIRITRTRKTIATPPVESKVQIASANEYFWDLNGNVFVSTVTATDGNFTQDLNVGRNATVTGIMTAGTFSGSGASLTSVPASAITAGPFGTGDYVINGRLGIGATAASATQLHITENDSVVNLRMERVDASISLNSIIAEIQIYGGEDGVENQVGNIRWQATENWTDTSSPTRLIMGTTPVGSTFSTENFTMDENGNVTIAGAITDGAASSLTTGTTIGNLTLANGSITDSSGAISFGNENLSTTGTATTGALSSTTGAFSGDVTMTSNTPNIFMKSPSATNSVTLNANISDAVRGGLIIKDNADELLNIKDSTLIFKTNGGTTALTIDSSQDSTFTGNIIGDKNLLIGTTAGEAIVHIEDGTGAVDDVFVQIEVTGGNIGDQSGIKFVGSSSRDLGKITSVQNASFLSDMTFSTASASNVLTNAMILDSSQNVDIPNGTLSAGINDSSIGTIQAYGSATGEGGQINIFQAGNEDSVFENWTIDSDSGGDLRIFTSDGASTALHRFADDGSVTFSGALASANITVTKASPALNLIDTAGTAAPTIVLVSGADDWVILTQENFSNGDLLFRFDGTGGTDRIQFSQTGNIQMDGTLDSDGTGANSFAGDVTLANSKSITIGAGNSGDNNVLLKFDIDRAWQFEVIAEGSVTGLGLRPLVDGKSFVIQSQDSTNAFQFATLNGVSIFTNTGDILLTGELKGAREGKQFSFNDSFAVSGTTQYLKYGEVLTSSTKGWLADRAGSILGLSILYDITATAAGGDLVIEVRKNGTTVFTASLDDATTGDNKETRATQARGTDTFVAGDLITMSIIEGQADSVTMNEIIASVDLQLDT